MPLATATWKGGLYGLPHVTDALGLQCNRELLAEAGLDAAPATWEELVAAGTSIADLDAQRYGFYTRGDSYWAQPFTWAWGGQLYEVAEDGSVTVLINSPESVAGWNYLQGQHPRDRRPGELELPGRVRQHDDRLQGRHDHVRHERSLAGRRPPHRRGLRRPVQPRHRARSPRAPPGNTGSPVGGHNYVVYALVGQDPDKQAAVLDLLAYINGTEAQAFLADTLGLLPTRDSAYADEAVAADPIISAWGEVMQKATNRSGHPKSPDIYVPYSNEYQAFIQGDKTAEEALAAIEAAWNELFAS